MDVFEREQILASFKILVDTREHNTPKARARYKSFGVPYEKALIDYGDYTYNVTLPSGELYKTGETVRPLCVVERKMDLDELAMCFGSERRRFKREFERATEHKAKIYLLIEDASWEKLLGGQYRSKYNPKALFGSLVAYCNRYKITPIMCESETSGKLIKELLYRDLKERLESGEFDE